MTSCSGSSTGRSRALSCSADSAKSCLQERSAQAPPSGTQDVHRRARAARTQVCPIPPIPPPSSLLPPCLGPEGAEERLEAQSSIQQQGTTAGRGRCADAQGPDTRRVSATKAKAKTWWLGFRLNQDRAGAPTSTPRTRPSTMCSVLAGLGRCLIVYP